MWEKMGQNGMKERFRGSYIAKIDDRGRVKIPAKYLSALELDFGKEVYLTSVNGDHVLIP
jgi:DNA-binding transcriptional regulator/RsmH inhibitor MraZ